MFFSYFFREKYFYIRPIIILTKMLRLLSQEAIFIHSFSLSASFLSFILACFLK